MVSFMSAPTVTDIVDGSRPVNCAPASGSTFPIGMTTVMCTASDTRGNSSNASFTVTVKRVAQQLTDLQRAVTGLGPGVSFVNKVENTLAAVQAGNIAQACMTP